MRISEIFTSIQGEGPYMGTPSHFVRFSGCNLRCRWCDTPYASWNPQGESMQIEAILQKLGPPARVRHCVITGGEPFLFEELPALCTALRTLGYTVTIETAGTIFQEVIVDLLSISPKLENSAPEGGSTEYHIGEFRERHLQRLRDRVPLQRLLNSGNRAILKFVVETKEQANEAQSLSNLWSEGLSTQREVPQTWLMPQAAKPEDLQHLAPQVAEWAVELGLHYSDRLHVRLWGDARGR